MSDLVKRLRERAWVDNGDGGNVFHEALVNPHGPEAADRIEQLERALVDLLAADGGDFDTRIDAERQAKAALDSGSDGRDG